MNVLQTQFWLDSHTDGGVPGPDKRIDKAKIVEQRRKEKLDDPVFIVSDTNPVISRKSQSRNDHPHPEEIVTDMSLSTNLRKVQSAKRKAHTAARSHFLHETSTAALRLFQPGGYKSTSTIGHEVEHSK